MAEIIISTEEVTKTIGNTVSWKAPGIDNIANYWLKKFTSTHDQLAKIFNQLIANPLTTPNSLTQGLTYLQPKDKHDTLNPAKYRPITCLPTIYKVLTAIIANKINTHITANNIINEEQKGCKKGARGCKEQLIIDTEITHQAKIKRRTLHCAYIDYQKAYDSIPHTWLKQILQIYKIDQKLIHFLNIIMEKWTTTLSLNTQTKQITSKQLHIRRGIFQGDSLSALWFCMAINPISHILNSSNNGYNISKPSQHKITHLLYMDDLKLYASTNQQLDNLIRLTETFSTDIGMAFGTEKCMKNSMIQGKYKKTENYTLDNNTQIEGMEESQYYKYLGYKQSIGIEHANIKEELKQKYTQRLKQILNTELSARNKTKAINTYAMPILTYSFGIIKWNNTELEELNRLTRTQCYKYKIHHIHSAIERFTLNRQEGGRGFVDIKNLHQNQINNLRKYFYEKAELYPTGIHNAIIQMDTSTSALKLQKLQPYR